MARPGMPPSPDTTRSLSDFEVGGESGSASERCKSSDRCGPDSNRKHGYPPHMQMWYSKSHAEGISQIDENDVLHRRHRYRASSSDPFDRSTN